MSTTTPQPTGQTSATVKSTGSPNPLTALLGNGYLVSLVTIVGLIVLMALGKVSVAEGLPPALTLAGVHLGSSVATP